MNWLDAILILPLLIGLVRGLMRGLVSEIIGIVAIVMGVIGARIWAKNGAVWLLREFAWPEAVCNVIAYALVFLGIAILLNLLGRLLSRLLRAINLGFVNRLLGGIFGTLKWFVVVITLVFLTSLLDNQFHFLSQSEVVKTSVVYPKFAKLSHQLFALAPSVGQNLVQP